MNLPLLGGLLLIEGSHLTVRRRGASARENLRGLVFGEMDEAVVGTLLTGDLDDMEWQEAIYTLTGFGKNRHPNQRVGRALIDPQILAQYRRRAISSP